MREAHEQQQPTQNVTIGWSTQMCAQTFMLSGKEPIGNNVNLALLQYCVVKPTRHWCEKCLILDERQILSFLNCLPWETTDIYFLTVSSQRTLCTLSFSPAQPSERRGNPQRKGESTKPVGWTEANRAIAKTRPGFICWTTTWHPSYQETMETGKLVSKGDVSGTWGRDTGRQQSEVFELLWGQKQVGHVSLSQMIKNCML